MILIEESRMSSDKMSESNFDSLDSGVQEKTNFILSAVISSSGSTTKIFSNFNLTFNPRV